MTSQQEEVIGSRSRESDAHSGPTPRARILQYRPWDGDEGRKGIARFTWGGSKYELQFDNTNRGEPRVFLVDKDGRGGKSIELSRNTPASFEQSGATVLGDLLLQMEVQLQGDGSVLVGGVGLSPVETRRCALTAAELTLEQVERYLGMARVDTVLERRLSTMPSLLPGEPVSVRGLARQDMRGMRGVVLPMNLLATSIKRVLGSSDCGELLVAADLEVPGFSLQRLALFRSGREYRVYLGSPFPFRDRVMHREAVWTINQVTDFSFSTDGEWSQGVSSRSRLVEAHLDPQHSKILFVSRIWGCRIFGVSKAAEITTLQGVLCDRWALPSAGPSAAGQTTGLDPQTGTLN